MKTKIWKCVALVLALMCILTFPIGVSATAQGTNGDEMQVATPEKLEIHLGQEWAGVTFELTTDYGKYPDPIPVGEDGVPMKFISQKAKKGKAYQTMLHTEFLFEDVKTGEQRIIEQFT